MSMRILCDGCGGGRDPEHVRVKRIHRDNDGMPEIRLPKPWSVLAFKESDRERQYYACSEECAETLMKNLTPFVEDTRAEGRGLLVDCDSCRRVYIGASQNETRAHWRTERDGDRETRSLDLPKGWRTLEVELVEGDVTTEMWFFAHDDQCAKQVRLPELKASKQA